MTREQEDLWWRLCGEYQALPDDACEESARYCDILADFCLDTGPGSPSYWRRRAGEWRQSIKTA